MTLKDDWIDGEYYTAQDANDVSQAVNALGGNLLGYSVTAVKTSAYGASVGELVPCDATSGGFTVTLPEAPADRSAVIVKKLDSSANVVTVQRSGSDVFNVAAGATSLQLTLPDQTVAVQYEAGDGIWYVVSHGVGVAALETHTWPNPQIDGMIKDVNGNAIIGLSATASAENYVQIRNAAAGLGRAYIDAVGADADIDFFMVPKGWGGVRISVATGKVPSLLADGDDADHDLFLRAKGAGIVQAGNMSTVYPVVTKAGVPSTITSTGIVGQMAADANYLYICTGANAWRRVGLSTWP